MFHILSHKGNTNQSDIEIPEWLSSKKQTTTNAGQDAGEEGRNT
jgi:hypothetical protein